MKKLLMAVMAFAALSAWAFQSLNPLGMSIGMSEKEAREIVAKQDKNSDLLCVDVMVDKVSGLVYRLDFATRRPCSYKKAKALFDEIRKDLLLQSRMEREMLADEIVCRRLERGHNFKYHAWINRQAGGECEVVYTLVDETLEKQVKARLKSAKCKNSNTSGDPPCLRR